MLTLRGAQHRWFCQCSHSGVPSTGGSASAHTQVPSTGGSASAHTQGCSAPVVLLVLTLRGAVHGILQARTLEWVAMLSSRGSSRLRDRPGVSCIAGDSLPLSHQGSPTLLITSKLMMVLPVLTLRGAHCWW